MARKTEKEIYDKDIEQYLGQAYAFILVDECAQFSPEAFTIYAASCEAFERS